MITYEDFASLDIRIGTIIEAEKITNSHKLLKLIIDLGEEKRQIVAGLANFYTPEELVSKDSPEFKELFPDVDLDTADWLTMIVKHPEIIRRPIAKRGKKVKVIEVPTEILKFIELETY